MTSLTPTRVATRPDLGLAILRIILGVVFLAHGWQKMFGIGPGSVAGMFSQMGIPLPGVSAAVVMTVEVLAGLALIVGLFTRPAALLLACDMLSAMLLVHVRNGFFLPTGFEFVLTLGAGAIALALSGPGAFALDNTLGRRRPLASDARVA